MYNAQLSRRKYKSNITSKHLNQIKISSWIEMKMNEKYIYDILSYDLEPCASVNNN